VTVTSVIIGVAMQRGDFKAGLDTPVLKYFDTSKVPGKPCTAPAVSGDAALGIEAHITRRDFLGSTLLASGAVLLEAMIPWEKIWKALPFPRELDSNGFAG
jgi:hypothetical protein